MIRLLAYIGLWLFAMFSIAISVAVGVLSALKTFWKQDMGNGINYAIDVASGVAMALEHKEKKNEKESVSKNRKA